MLLQESPLSGARWALLVENGGRHHHLANVVEQAAPLQLAQLIVAEAHLLTDQAGQKTDPL